MPLDKTGANGDWINNKNWTKDHYWIYMCVFQMIFSIVLFYAFFFAILYTTYLPINKPNSKNNIIDYCQHYKTHCTYDSVNI